MTFQFNHDLLLNDTDQAAARGLFPSVFFALDHPELRKLFGEFNDLATVAKRRSRKWGIIAVILATIALLIVSAEPLYKLLGDEELKKFILAGAAVCGLTGVLIGVTGTLFSGRARRWLQQRMAAERLRQFHFQWLVARAPEIAAAAGNSVAQEALIARRSAEFAAFRRDFVAHLEAEYSASVVEEDAPDCWLFPESEHAKSNIQADMVVLFTAFERLRLKPQLQYTAYRLHGDGRSFSPARQAAFFSGVALSCVFIVFVLHGVALVGAMQTVAWTIEPFVHTFAIWAAIVALAIRTLEEGLGPHRELERLREYRSAVRLISERMTTAEAPAAKLAAMREMEEVAYEEMINFLKSNAEAHFLM
mgnify:CR=1 FL=1